MQNEKQTRCAFERASCACQRASANACECGVRCQCQASCRCGASCQCAQTRG